MLASDNQQATRIGWFVGILEGEGSFRNAATGGSAVVTISNTDFSIVEGCESFLRTNHIWFVRDAKPRNGRTEYVIRVTNSGREVFQYADLLYKLISPSLECRHDQYQTILGAPTTTRDLSVDLDWLAAIYEAEGSFSLTLDYRKNAALAITITNTNTRIVEKVLVNLKSLHCGCHLRDKKHYKHQSHYKPAKIIAICGMLRCRTFLTRMEGRWVSEKSKRLSANILEFSESRLSRSRKEPYSERELRLIQSCVDLNG
jgi:hypothetical protein